MALRPSNLANLGTLTNMLWLFNPSAPHADPIGPSIPDTLSNNCCGRCISVPRYWRIKKPALDPSHEGSPGFDLTKIMFGKDFTPTRDFAVLQSDGKCQWRCPVDVSEFYGIGATGEWAIYFSNDGLGKGGWWAVAQTHTGFPGTEFLAAYRFFGNYFECLKPNELTFAEPPDSGIVAGPPPKITIEPFWP